MVLLLKKKTTGFVLVMQQISIKFEARGESFSSQCGHKESTCHRLHHLFLWLRIYSH